MKYTVKLQFFLFVFIILFINTTLASNINHPMPLNSSQTPWRSIGVLQNNNKKCVAVVVGNNVLLTSAYCLFDENGNKLTSTQNLIFKSAPKDNFYLMKSSISSFVMPTIIYPPNNIYDIKNSWAFLFTSQNIANITGSIKIYKEPITSEYLKTHKIITVGYSDKEDNRLFASIQCKFNNSGIEYNNNSFIDTETTRLLLQTCSDNFMPLIGSPVLSIDKNNNISVIGIISAKLTKNKKDNNENKETPEIINVIVPMTSLNKSSKTSTNEETTHYNNKDLEEALKS